MLGRRHPRLTARFATIYETTPIDTDPDQPKVIFRGVVCIRCEALLVSDESLRIGLCIEHLPSASSPWDGLCVFTQTVS